MVQNFRFAIYRRGCTTCGRLRWTINRIIGVKAGTTPSPYPAAHTQTFLPYLNKSGDVRISFVRLTCEFFDCLFECFFVKVLSRQLCHKEKRRLRYNELSWFILLVEISQPL